ncbi:STAS domain-containing protein [Hyphomicrobium sp.]|uniref:STAS domain-containing protein n=1 Tax=Hyphomicrobium sp. TaxID=82 RepID=UPI000FB15C5C|nr:STAS domain-containing protein [Hyphomicrobium sp.]RUO97405.1 MAG: anti-sigma factor antagonist [Hyphomicrobium sp.]
MRLDQVVLPGGIIKLKVTGPLDIAGAGEIDAPFNAISSKNDRIIVDFKDVTFLASIGIRLLVKAARNIAKRNGRLIVFSPTDDARKVLRSTGIDSIVPVVADEAAAISACG